MASCGEVGACDALAQHLLNGVARDEVDQEKDDRDHQPDDREGVENTLKEVAKHI